MRPNQPPSGDHPGQQPRHPIGVVARRTGLKPDLIRAWERRYGAVEPGRSDTRRRFYSDADIRRLLLLRQVVKTGRGIGQVAHLANPELEALIAEEPGASPGPAAPAAFAAAAGDEGVEPFLSACLAAAQRLEVGEIERQLERASVAMSRLNLLEKLLVPLMHRVGDLWQDGTLRPVHEHLASSVVRTFLGNMSNAYLPEPGAPQLIVTTPARQLHELGALIVAATAAHEGWRVTYLGPNLPPEEIAAAVFQKRARAVALSVTYPPDDPMLSEELRRIRRLLGPEIEILVGGRSADGYAAALHEIGARGSDTLADLRRALNDLRRKAVEAVSSAKIEPDGDYPFQAGDGNGSSSTH
ncbi:MAG TPA: cobalamin-dependent protein [Thermoanaerobaculia bacterium]|jgi:methanogenic corrinoid protein MtbC1|nr:cobalamin-dependent protein [Thermoanaerobaculia bacterium]